MQIMPWECEYCHASFKRESNYSRHTLTCRLIQESSLDKDEGLPSYQELCTMVVHLARKQERYEKDMQKLKMHERRIRKKISYPDWLNQNRKPSQSLKTWTSSTSLQPGHFQTVVSDSNFMRAVTTVVKDLVLLSRFLHMLVSKTNPDCFMFMRTMNGFFARMTISVV